MLHSPQSAYKQAAAMTSTPSQLLLMLYDGCIRFIKAGVDGIQERNIEKAHNNLIKAQSIIYELIRTLDMKYPISKQLISVYEYMIHQLVQANKEKAAAPAEEVLAYVMELREAWLQASKQAGGSPGMTNP